MNYLRFSFFFSYRYFYKNDIKKKTCQKQKIFFSLWKKNWKDSIIQGEEDSFFCSIFMQIYLCYLYILNGHVRYDFWSSSYKVRVGLKKSALLVILSRESDPISKMLNFGRKCQKKFYQKFTLPPTGVWI